jgi:beta-carotene hydroxylase
MEETVHSQKDLPMPQLLRYAADRRTVAYMLLTTALLFIQWNLPSFNPILFVLCLFMAVSVSVIAHNHNHLPIWRYRFLNIVMDYWITLFYGFPTFAWIPTHNSNHHKFNNRKGDYTITYRVSEANNILTLVSYPSVSSYFQQRPIRDYLANLWRTNKAKFWLAISQYAVLVLFYAGALWLDWKKALLFIIIPDQVSLFSVLIFNYVQHVHADEESRYNHSRNFVGLLNTMLFNNGYHTIHHEHPGIHWSETPAKQKEIEREIDPALVEKSFWWYLIRVYVIGGIFPRFRTVSMRLRRLGASVA